MTDYKYYIDDDTGIIPKLTQLETHIDIDMDIINSYPAVAYNNGTKILTVTFVSPLSETEALILTRLVETIIFEKNPDTDIQSRFKNHLPRESIVQSDPPTTSHDILNFYVPGSQIIDQGTNDIYYCINNTQNAAVWKKLSQSITYPTGAAVNIAPCHYYESHASFSQTLSGTAITIDYDTESQNTGTFFNTSGEITINTTDVFEIIFHVSVDNTINSNSIASHILELNAGGGFAGVTGTQVFSYHRNSIEGENSVTCSTILNLTSGDIIRVRSMRYDTSSTGLITIADSSGITIKSICGVAGPTGPTGYTVGALVGTNGDTGLQETIDGGNTTIIIQEGTTTLNSTIGLMGSTQITGANKRTSILSFNDTASSIQANGMADGGVRITTGTIAVINGSATVTGTTTSFTSLNSGKNNYILIGDHTYHKITSIETNTSLTLENPYEGATQSGLSFVAQSMIDCITIKNLTIKSSSTYALDIQAAIHVNIQDVCFQNSGATGGAECVNLSYCGHVFISRCTFDNSHSSGCTVSNSTDVHFDNCHSDNNALHGIRIPDSRSIVINNCLVTNNGLDAIFIENASQQISISNTTLACNASNGINIASTASQINISNAHITNNTSHGITADGFDITVTGCHISNNGGNGTLINGYGTNHQITITGNTIQNNSADGIGVTGANSNILSSNIVTNNAGTGINIGNSNNNIISSNRCSTNNIGVSINAYSTSNIISSNQLLNNTVTNLDDNGVSTTGFANIS